MSATGFEAARFSTVRTVIALSLGAMMPVVLGACTGVNAPDIEVTPIGGSNGAGVATAGSPFGSGTSAGTDTEFGSGAVASGATSGPTTGGSAEFAEFGPQPNADFSNCGVMNVERSSPAASSGLASGTASSGTVAAASGSGAVSGGVGPTPLPFFGSTVTTRLSPPPPISGGTLIGLQSGSIAVASDPDRDAVYVVDTSAGTVLHSIALQSGDEPGRLVEDGSGYVHIALRSGGALVTIDPGSGTVLARRAVCPAPRGVAWDSTTDLVWVACATGELVGLPAAGGQIAKQWVVERDLRDVLIRNGVISVTEFRSAQVLRLNRDGTIARRDSILPVGLTTPQVAWRAAQTSAGTFVAHQDDATVSLSTDVVGGYGFGQGGAAIGSCALIDDATGAELGTSSLSNGVLPVDFAITPDGSALVFVLAGNGFSVSLLEVQALPIGSFSPAAGGAASLGAGASSGTVVSTGGLPINGSISGAASSGTASLETGGPAGPPFMPEQLIAVAFDSAGRLLVQSREPAILHILDRGSAPAAQALSSGLSNPIGGTQVTLATISRDDTGHDIFHEMAGAAIACASCHPEGGDDGHIWILDGFARRTPSLRGTIAGTAPYHWPGDQPDFPTLTTNVYTGRMGGQHLTTDQTGALESWVESIPAPASPSWLDLASASRGNEVFESTGCGTCHSGPKFTNNMTMDVGTCGAYQVPPLVGVGWRTPLMHNGCAATIADRFGKCSTSGHGSVQGLSSGQISDLTAYLETL